MNLFKIKSFLIAVFITIAFTNCATIFGGSSYYGHAIVKDHPKAKITYNDQTRTNGFARFKIKRAKANQVTFIVTEDSCESQKFRFNKKKLRWGALVTSTVGSVFVNAFYIQIPIDDTTKLTLPPIPGFAIFDIITGAAWKPYQKEKGITKVNFRQYQYTLNYTGCETKNAKIAEEIIISQPAITREPVKPVETPVIQQEVPVQNTTPQNKGQEKIARLKELKRLQDEGILTPEEFEREKQKVLNDEF